MNTCTIHPIPALEDNYIWAIIDKNAKTALIVDPGVANPVQNFLKQQQLTLVGIFITHHHWDHTNGIAELIKDHPVPVFGPGTENIAGMTNKLAEKDKVRIADFPLTFTVLSIPGHTAGHIAYYSPGMLFCGDTLFACGCGRIFEGTPQQMYASLQKIAALPDDTRIYCAHEYTLANLRFAKQVEPSNVNIDDSIKIVKTLRDQGLPSLPSLLKDEKATNPFLRCEVKEVIESVQHHAGEKLTKPVAIFAALREWKNHFKS